MLIFFIGPSHLSAVFICIKKQGVVTKWKTTGVLLQLPYSDLEVIRRNEDNEEDRMMATLNKWLTSGKASKKALADALQML